MPASPFSTLPAIVVTRPSGGATFRTLLLSASATIRFSFMSKLHNADAVVASVVDVNQALTVHVDAFRPGELRGVAHAVGKAHLPVARDVVTWP